MASKSKPPEMPIVQPKDGVHRRNMYVRLNPNGDEEVVITKKGKPDKGTLSELDTMADDLLGLLESVSFGQSPAMSAEQPSSQRIVNQPSPPQLVASRGEPARANGDSLTNMTVAPQSSELGLGPTPADGPELSRAKSPLNATSMNGRSISKYNLGPTTESFVGTGAIAFAPVALGSQPSSPIKGKRKRQSENKDNTTNRLESSMTTRRTLNEWLPPFKGNGYNPGEHTMPEPSGKGVADRTPTQEKVGSYDTDLSSVGKEWPRDANDNEAMDRVDDENISDSASGAHESTHGEADDGHQKKLGHDWPKQPKNAGQGVAEPFGGDRWSDGGVLPQGHGPGADTWTHTDGPGMPSDGPITGTDGPQLGHVSEGWNPNNMARLMGDDFDVQGLFNSYARTRSAVCVEDFQGLLDAHGADVVIDESSLLQLMQDNAEFMFMEGQDGDGPYWVPEPILEGENRRPFNGKPISEMQIRSPEDEAALYRDDPLATDDIGGPGSGLGGPGGGMLDRSGGLDDVLGGADDFGGGGPEDMMGGAGSQGLECPGCGYTGEDAECPECGVEMMDPMGEAGLDGLPGSDGDPIEAVLSRKHEQLADDGEYDSPADDRGMWESREIVTGPQLIESLRNFMGSARSLIERNPRAKNSDIAEALNHSWDFYARDVDAESCPSKVQQTLQGLMRKFPGFSPLVENQAMNRPEGTKLGGGDGPKDNLPKQPTEITTHGDKSLLGRHQKNNLDGTPTVSGTGKGLTGKSVNESAVAGGPGQAPGARAAGGVIPSSRPAAAPRQAPTGPTARPSEPLGVATKQVQENVSKLAAHVRRAVAEGAKALGQGKYSTHFSVLVAEGKPAFLKDKEKAPKGKKKNAPPEFTKKKKNRTPKRDNLAEALYDAEEILQLHDPANVTFETMFVGPNGQVVLKHDTPLFTINPRGPMVGEGKAIFRFTRTAEAFANELVTEGVVCRIVPHNWGSAVEARTNYPTAERAFSTLAECGAGCGSRKKKRK